MKMRSLALLLLLSIGGMCTAQAQKKVESEGAIVKFSVNPEGDLKVGAPATLKIEVTPKAGWHVYSALPSEDGAYMPAAVGWDITSRGFTAEESLKEEGPMISAFDEIMNGTVRYYKTQVTFSQPMVLTEKEVILEGYFDYMACNDEKCIPLTADLKLQAKAKE